MAKGVGVGVGEGGACKYSGERWAQRGGGGGGGVRKGRCANAEVISRMPGRERPYEKK